MNSTKIRIKDRIRKGLFLLFVLCLSAQISAQNISVALEKGTLKELFEQIEKSSEYRFAYLDSDLPTRRDVSVNAKNKKLETLLDELLPSRGLIYARSGNTYSVKKKVFKSIVVSGSVADTRGEELIGASVLVKGSTNGTITDIDGRFSLTAPDNAVLVISYVGYLTKEVRLTANSSSLKVVIEEDARKLDELVVVGYGTQRKSLVTNAISSFKPSEASMRPVLNPGELLQGRVAGVTISTGSGNLGSGERMSIRGAASLSASNEPLYVIDGVPIVKNNASLFNFGESMSSLAVLNLTDIESIEVLKDAASAAIYGSRATNGVVVITTKSGREGKSEVRVNFSTGVSQFANPGRIKYANSDQYVTQYNVGVVNYNEQYGLVPGKSGYKIPISNPYQGLPDTDWLGLITQNGVQYNTDMAFSGGTQKTKFYVGGNYNYQEGVIKTNSISKLNLKAKISHEMKKWLEIGANVSGNYMKNHQVPGANIGSTIVARAVEQRPFDRPYKPNGDYYVGGTDELTRHNPMQILNEQKAYVDTYRFIGSFYGLFKWKDKFTFRSSINLDEGYTYDYVYYNEKHPYGAGGGRVVEYNRFADNVIIENVANYSDKLGNFALGVMAGHSFQRTNVRTSMIDGRGMPSPTFDVIDVASVIFGANGGISEYAMESYFGRLNLSYKDRYVMNATLRTDGSSRFAPEHRYGLFPSLSFGWNASNEAFWNEKSIDLKIRASYGKTGNQDGISNYGWRMLMGGGLNYGQNSGIAITNFGNSSLTWETADQYDVGFDFGVMNGKINMMADFYLKNTNNLLYSRPTHATSGVTSILSNVGSMRNIGAEFTLNTHFNLGRVQWNSSFNISHNRNKLTKLIDDNIMPIGDNRALQVGKPLGSYYIFDMQGIYQYDGEVPQAQYDLGVRAGDVKWRDVDGNGIINDNDRVITGCSNPKFSGGWNNGFKYAGFELDIFFTYMYGNDIYAQWANTASRPGYRMAILEDYATKYWTGPGSTNYYPRPFNSDTNNSRNSTRFLEDGSFIRLRSLTLSYNLPPATLKKIGLSSLRLFVQGDNLFLLSNYSGWDPEVSTNLDPQYFGNDNYGVPQPRTVSAGFNLSF